MSVVKSISDNEDDILLGIMQLHNGGQPFCADVCHNVGGFYRSGKVPRPEIRFDIAPTLDDVTQADACALPLKNASVTSIVFDPPFMFNPHGKALEKNAAAGRYTMFPTWADLERTYKGALNEFNRILKPKGIVAFKCQDYTDSKTTMTHCLVYQWAVERGFYAKDLFIRYRNHGPAYNPALRQKHARKFHSYWWVFQRARTYTNPGDTVLDNTCGSGTTLVAAINTGRNAIGIERDETYFAIARKRIGEARPVPANDNNQPVQAAANDNDPTDLFSQAAA